MKNNNFEEYLKIRNLLDQKILKKEIPLESLKYFMNMSFEFYEALTQGKLVIAKEGVIATQAFKPSTTRPHPKLYHVTDTFSVTLLQGVSLEEIIKQGNFDYVDKNINSTNFSVQNTNQRDADIVLIPVYGNSFPETKRRYGLSKREEKERDKLLLKNLNELILEKSERPAYIEELVALGAKYKNIQSNNRKILAVGSVYINENNYQIVAGLTKSGGRQGMTSYELAGMLQQASNSSDFIGYFAGIKKK